MSATGSVSPATRSGPTPGASRPWPLHYSHRVAINRDSQPGWSLYGVDPADAGDLGASLTAAHSDEWCAAEWLPTAGTAAEWAGAYERTLRSAAAGSSPSTTGRASGGTRTPLPACAAPSLTGPGLGLLLVTPMTDAPSIRNAAMRAASESYVEFSFPSASTKPGCPRSVRYWCAATTQAPSQKIS